MIIRKATGSDINQIVDIENACMSMPWSFCSFDEAMHSNHTIFLVAVEDEKVLGYVVLYLTNPEAELPDIVVSEEYRGKGVGKLLMEEALKSSKELGITDIYLEVRQTNTVAHNMYLSFGFTEMGIRKNFYENPVENAICMHKAL